MAFIHISDEVLQVLAAKDARLGKIIREIGKVKRQGTDDVFEGIIISIVSQQLSAKAADTIFDRLAAIVGEVNPANIYKTDIMKIKSAGLSLRKAEYIKGIAEAILFGGFDIEGLHHKSDKEAIEEITKLKGLGVWSAEMLLIFSFNRPDILSFNDLGIQKGLEYLYYDMEYDFEQIKKKFSPHCSVLSLYLWEIASRGRDWVKEILSKN